MQRRDFLKKTTISSLSLITGSSVLAGLTAFTSEKLSFTSSYMEGQFSAEEPGIAVLNIDGLGLNKRGINVMKTPDKAAKAYILTESSDSKSHRVDYRLPEQPVNAAPLWSIQVTARQIKLTSNWSDQHQTEPLTLSFNMSKCHTTLLGLFNDDSTLKLPAVMHLPGQGSVQITARGNKNARLGYHTHKAASDLKLVFFPSSTSSATEYILNITAIYPELNGIKGDHRFDSFKRNWLNVLQLNPNTKLLSNNAASTSCAFCYYEYADIAAKSPVLVDYLR